MIVGCFSKAQKFSEPVGCELTALLESKKCSG